MPAQGVTGPFEAMSARPAKMLMRVDVPAVGHVESGYDGKVGWEIDPAAGPSVATGRKLSELADDAFFDSSLHGATFVKSATLVGQEMFDKRPAYQVQVTFVSGNEQTEYYDVETGLMLGSEAQRETPLGVVPTISILRDYKKFGALMQATSLVSRTMGIEQIVRLTSIEYNTVPANAFDLPPRSKRSSAGDVAFHCADRVCRLRGLTRDRRHGSAGVAAALACELRHGLADDQRHLLRPGFRWTRLERRAR